MIKIGFTNKRKKPLVYEVAGIKEAIRFALKDGKDLSYADLRGVDLSYMDLRRNVVPLTDHDTVEEKK